MVPWIDQAVNQLANSSWCHIQNAVDPQVIAACNAWIDQQVEEDHFTSAGVGRGERFQQNNQIRSDRILWFDDSDETEQLLSLRLCLKQVRETLNRELFAGLQSFEGHFAVYPAGGFYKRHVDSFKDDDSRSVSFILYLNPNWRPGDGGELLLELDDGRDYTVHPKSGTVVMFDSRKFAHEVLPSIAERRSFTGWFKVQKL